MKRKYKSIVYTLFLLNLIYGNDSDRRQHPNVNFNLFSGNKTSIEELIKKGPLVVQFWAIWCSPCKKEMHYLDKIQKEYKDSGVNVVCVNTDNLKSIPKAKAFVRQKKYNLLVALDPSAEIFKKLNASVMPTTLIFDQNGQIVYSKEGYINGDEKNVEEKLKSMLKL